MPRLFDRHTKRQPSFYEGYNAFKSGKLSNPYKGHSLAAKEWQHGFDIGYLDNKYKTHLRDWRPRSHTESF